LVGAGLNFCIHPPLIEPIWYQCISLVNMSVKYWALNPKYMETWNFRICIGCMSSPLHLSAPRWWYASYLIWQLNFTYRLYSFQTRFFCINLLEDRSSIGTSWLLRGPILLNHPFMILIFKCQYSNLVSHFGFKISLIEELHDANFDEQLQSMGCNCGF
jgi:hypothetical protein